MLLLAAVPDRLQAQDHAAVQEKSSFKAFALSMLLPGLGQRYLQDGQWNGWAPVFTGADAALGLRLAGTIWYRDQQVEAYRTLAAGSAGADVESKNRSFFVQMAAYESQKRYVEYLLRSRQWVALEEAEDPSRFWNWSSEDDWDRYRETRSNADALNRRRTILITALVANRLVSGVTALLQARSNDNVPEAAVDLTPGAGGKLTPRLRMRFEW